MVDHYKEKPRFFGTKEWSVRSENCVNGCAHGCWYCYAKAEAVTKGHNTVDGWTSERFRVSASTRRIARAEGGRVMFPSTHDITPDMAGPCLDFLARLLDAGNDVLLVSKPHLVVIEALCERFMAQRQHILFRFTIGSSHRNVLTLLEPHAPGYEERVACLTLAHQLGYETSVSMEPMLDLYPERVVDDVLPWVTDNVWLGLMNFPTKRMQVNGAPVEALQYVRDLMRDQHEGWIKQLYARYRDNPHVHYKESMKRVLGLELASRAGEDK